MLRNIDFIARRLAAVSALACVLTGATASSSSAAAPILKLSPMVTDFASAGEEIRGFVVVQNVGDQATNGPFTISDTVNSGLLPPSLEGFVISSGWNNGFPACETVGQTFKCEVPSTLPPGARIEIQLTQSIPAGAVGALTNTFSVTGGGLAGTTTDVNTTTLGSPGPFAFSEAAVELLDGAGAPVVQAGSVPAQFTTRLNLKTSSQPFFGGLRSAQAGVEHFKDMTVNLPVGFAGNPQATESLCTVSELSQLSSNQGLPDCPADSQVGTAWVGSLGENFYTGLYNVVPPPGRAAELGFNILGVVIGVEGYLRPGDAGISVVSRNTNITYPISFAYITVWGNPEASSHDNERGSCLIGVGMGAFGANGQACPTLAPHRAFLRLPTSCTGSPLAFSARTNSYEHPETYMEKSFTSPTITGCELVPFAPEISVFPTGTAANSPTGVSVRVSSPQNSNPEGLGEADLKKAVVTLPEGMAINPSAADGLEACSDAQLRVGLEGPAECPDGSKIGTVLLHTPLLSEPIEGNVYILSQKSSDPESGEMFRIAMELRNDARGIDIKVPGAVNANRTTGRLTTTFDDNPQLPFNDITLNFKSGARAPLTTPISCEPQTTEANLYSWAEPGIPVHRSNSFSLTSGPEGTPCVTQQGFNPGFNAGVSSVQAGGLTPFLTTFTRKDADQTMQRVSVKLPLGVSGSLTGLPLCPEAQASTGKCESGSEIGSVTAGAGSGPTPFYVTGGKVFMTSPYEGAPFGLSIVVPAKAGPFDLGNVNVRAKVEVDPHTAQLTVTSDPLPQIVGGVPVNLRLVNVTINRPNFTFNPTSCDPLSVTGTMTGGQGTVAALSDHFQVTNCGALAFKPSFKVSTPGRTSRKNGAGLDVKLTYPTGGFGKDANIAKVKVALPKQLPSRLTTLQKACPAATFEANPAGCPSQSRIGTTTATTPIIPVPLSGPVYFVSHGGEAFPNLVVVLQGYGVTVDLVGDTFISKAGITSTTFKQVPDVPVGTFELKLPQGAYSALAANGNLCASKLKMPTAFVAQDGAELHQSTAITVTGCPKHKAKKLSHAGSAKHNSKDKSRKKK